MIDIVVENIETKDWPDMSNTFISSAKHKDGTPLTEDELDLLNEDGDFIHKQILEALF